ncbi:hypothetical protein [Mycobacterium sp. 852002-40037_SCH5390672]|uniref:hypothetical protein n=1 Tax=Mycobacterium sp. 852002-40037_SCH5390672 TaxID=1834089 RepID=UPI001E3BA5CE|nr:hypothetical protein [Mycobacterium sp. 852002-40037_SCH5390672]
MSARHLTTLFRQEVGRSPKTEHLGPLARFCGTLGEPGRGRAQYFDPVEAGDGELRAGYAEQRTRRQRVHRQLHTRLAATLPHVADLHMQAAKDQRVGPGSGQRVGGVCGFHAVIEADDECQRRRRHAAMHHLSHIQGAIAHHRHDAGRAERRSHHELPAALHFVDHHQPR